MFRNKKILQSTNLSFNQESQRLSGLDLARIIAMIMMVQGHVIFELTNPALIDYNNLTWNIWNFFRGLTAPIFLTVSGIVQVFANKRDETGILPKKTISRRIFVAVNLILIGYLLVFPAEKIFHLPFVESTVWGYFFQVNVLQMIGVSLLIVLLLFKLTKNDKSLGLASLFGAIAVFSLTPFVFLVDWFKYLPIPIAAYLSIDKGTLFPIFPYTGFILAGVAVGTYLKSLPKEKRYKNIIRYAPIVGIALLIISYFVSLIFNPYNSLFFDPLKANPGTSIMRLGCVLIFISIVSIIYQFTQKFSNFYSILGKRALFVYVAHLILLYGIPWIPSIGRLKPGGFSLEFTIPFAILIILISLSSAYFYEVSIARNFKRKVIFRYSLTALIAYLLFV
ncbi:MAG: DUF1624 domain-containing protein [Candidatus Kapabacteria bacterium]|nr:DUF1624 domain-containing protein [Candidatus Kapabacteria bacterium]